METEIGCDSRSECQREGLGGRRAKRTASNRGAVRQTGSDRLHPANKSWLRRDKDKFDGDQGTVNVVLTLGDERRLQRLDAVMVAMIDGASVFGRIIDEMPMDDWPSRV